MHQGLKPMAMNRGPVGARCLDVGRWLEVHQGLKPVAIDRGPVGAGSMDEPGWFGTGCTATQIVAELARRDGRVALERYVTVTQ